MSAICTLSTGLQGGQYQTDFIRIMITILGFLPHCRLGVYFLWKMKVFKACHNKYINLWCEERDGAMQNAPLTDSVMN